MVNTDIEDDQTTELTGPSVKKRILYLFKSYESCLKKAQLSTKGSLQMKNPEIVFFSFTKLGGVPQNQTISGLTFQCW